MTRTAPTRKQPAATVPIYHHPAGTLTLAVNLATATDDDGTEIAVDHAESRIRMTVTGPGGHAKRYVVELHDLAAAALQAYRQED